MPSNQMDMRYDNNTTGRKSWFVSTGGLLVAFGVLTVLLTVYTMPSGRSVRYEPSEGSPWMYDELIAPFSFPIEKSREDIARETDSLRNAFIPYFAIDSSVRQNALAALDRLFSDSLSTVISAESFRMIKNKLSEICINRHTLLSDIRNRYITENVTLINENCMIQNSFNI